MTQMQNQIEFNDKKHEFGVLFLVFFKTFIIMGNVSQDPVLFSILGSFSDLLLLFILITKKWTKREWGVLFLTTPLLVLTYYFSKDGVLLWSFLVVMLAVDIPKKKILTSFLAAALIKNVVTFVLSFFGVYTPFTHLKPGTDVIRYSFGFAHANTIHLFLFAMILAYLTIRKEKVTLKELGVLFLLNMLLFVFTHSRTSTGLVALLILVWYVLTFQPLNIEKYLKSVMKWSAILTFVLAFSILLLSLTYHLNSNSFVELLNAALSRRIEQANWYFVENGISMMGQFIPTLFVKKSLLFVLDNGYMRVLIQFGVIPFTMLMASIILTVRKFYTERSYYELAAMCISAVAFILENYLGFIFINISLIYLSTLFEGNRIKTYSAIELPFNRSKMKEFFMIQKSVQGDD